LSSQFRSVSAAGFRRHPPGPIGLLNPYDHDGTDGRPAPVTVRAGGFVAGSMIVLSGAAVVAGGTAVADELSPHTPGASDLYGAFDDASLSFEPLTPEWAPQGTFPSWTEPATSPPHTEALSPATQVPFEPELGDAFFSDLMSLPAAASPAPQVIADRLAHESDGAAAKESKQPKRPFMHTVPNLEFPCNGKVSGLGSAFAAQASAVEACQRQVDVQAREAQDEIFEDLVLRARDINDVGSPFRDCKYSLRGQSRETTHRIGSTPVHQQWEMEYDGEGVCTIFVPVADSLKW
jgi:hypothetical protein